MHEARADHGMAFKLGRQFSKELMAFARHDRRSGLNRGEEIVRNWQRHGRLPVRERGGLCRQLI
jgi:hypothetical protein